jgi:HNH endonuclease
MTRFDDEVTGSAWQQAHQELVRLATSRARLDFEEGQRLRTALHAGAHLRLGYGSFVEYIERLFGYSPRLTYEKLRVAEALEQLKELATALRNARVNWSVVRELTRVATPETEREWLNCTNGLTARQVQGRVCGHCPGSRPTDPPDDMARRHVLRFEVSGEAFAAFRQAMANIRRDAGGPLDDDATLLLMARHALGGSRDVGRASYQVAVTVCEKCRCASQDGHGEIAPVAAEVLEMAECDGEHIGSVCAGAPNASAHVGKPKRAAQSIPPAIRRLVLRRDRHRCVFPGCRHTLFVDVHHIRSKADGGGHAADNLITLCCAHHRALHRGDVVVEGCAPFALRFSHGDGTAYGDVVSPSVAEIQTNAFRALRRMGFGEAEVRQAISQAAADCESPPTLESVLRSALLKLTERRATRAA